MNTPLLDIKRILIPTDFSSPSERAMQYALRIAAKYQATLVVLHVAEAVTHAPAHCDVPGFMKSLEISKKERREHLLEFTQRLSECMNAGSMPVLEIVTADGEAAEQIVRTASEKQVDLIVIATHGYTGLKRFMVGGTTRKVVTHAGCPVLVVRENEHEFIALPEAGAAARAS